MNFLKMKYYISYSCAVLFQDDNYDNYITVKLALHLRYLIVFLIVVNIFTSSVIYNIVKNLVYKDIAACSILCKARKGAWNPTEPFLIRMC